MSAGDMTAGVGGSPVVGDALDQALADLIQAETFTEQVRADVETVLAEVATAYELGSWALVFPTSGKTLSERREHVDRVRAVSRLQPHEWINRVTE